MKRGFWRTVDGVVAKSDIVLYILDARYPHESRNTDLEKLVRRKGRRMLTVFNKSDLLGEQKILVPKELHTFVIVSGKRGHGIPKLKGMLKSLSPNKEGKPIVGVVGYPNVGKSSIINRLKGYGTVRVSSQPGFTRGKQYVSTTHFFLIDTPGVIPREEKDDVKHLKMVSKPFDQEDPELAVFQLMDAYPGLIEQHFGIGTGGDHNDALEGIARKRNWIGKGGLPDTMRTAKAILQLWQDAKITPSLRAKR